MADMADAQSSTMLRVCWGTMGPRQPPAGMACFDPQCMDECMHACMHVYMQHQTVPCYWGYSMRPPMHHDMFRLHKHCPVKPGFSQVSSVNYRPLLSVILCCDHIPIRAGLI